MTDLQFIELLERLENFQLLVFIGFAFLLVAIGWLIGGQR